MNIRKAVLAKQIAAAIILCLGSVSLTCAQAEEHAQAQNAKSAAWLREHVVTNPVTSSWIKEHLNRQSPRLMLTEPIERKIKDGIQNNALMRAYFNYLRQCADRILTEPILKRKKIGKRLLRVSREAVRRIGILAFVYRFTHEQRYLDRLAREIDAVSHFSDWNPSHFLDVAEMSYAVAIGLDWAGQWLPKQTVEGARAALKQNLVISLHDKPATWWIDENNNWNQVCHSGLSVAALELAGQYPDLAAKIISRALKYLPVELASYSPSGAYPEGPSYWRYGTSYTLLAVSAFESAFGTDFHIPQVPGFMESATYRLETIAPSGENFNYFDSSKGDGYDLRLQGALAWFGQKTGDALYFNSKRILSTVKKVSEEDQKPPRFAPEYLIWLSQFEKKKDSRLPVYWKGEGHNPVAIFRARRGSKTQFYLGVKGGSASVNHANMDVGSFVFELNGVRWAIDPGTHAYHELEEIMGSNLWDESQNSQRWSLLTKGNKFHSTITVNGERHYVGGFAPITKYQVANRPESVTLDLSGVFKDQLDGETRTFKKLNSKTLQIEDDIKPTYRTDTVTWAMMTQADVTTTAHGAVLKQDGKQLRLKVVEPADLNVSVVSLNPPPLSYDKKIKNLKRIEIKIPSYMLQKEHQRVIVQIEGVSG